jgi:hypothetical protein
MEYHEATMWSYVFWVQNLDLYYFISVVDLYI